jgi:hypothetical protein
MSRIIAQKKYYKLSFSVDVETMEDVNWVREQMETLEKEPLIMRCYQNVRVHDGFTNNPKVVVNDWSSTCNTFAIYYREENNTVIDKFLFKVKLKFPNF